jgi:hypothetical protein
MIQLLCAWKVNDISTIFDFASAIAVSFISFWFPSIYYLIAEKRYGIGNKYSHNMAIVLNILGVLNFCLGISTGVLNIIKPSSS